MRLLVLARGQDIPDLSFSLVRSVTLFLGPAAPVATTFLRGKPETAAVRESGFVAGDMQSVSSLHVTNSFFPSCEGSPRPAALRWSVDLLQREPGVISLPGLPHCPDTTLEYDEDLRVTG